MRIIVYICLLLGVFVSGSASAQKCDPDYEAITHLRKPEIGSYNMWDAVYGELALTERFTAGVVSVSKNVVVVGERFAYEDGDMTIIMTELDRRGRIIWEQAHKVKGIRKITTFLKDKDGYIVVADQKTDKGKHHVWIGFFDLMGGLTKEKTVSDKKFDLYSNDMILMEDGKTYMLAAFAQGRGYESAGSAIIYKLNHKGDAITDRAYAPGLENRILGLARVDKNHYVAAGYLRAEDGRKVGWVLKLDEKGAIIWQRQYPRGLAAQVRGVADYTDQYIVTIGDAEPSDRKNRAGWVMLLDGNEGDIGWQRYYKGEFDFQGRDILTHDDGLVSVLLDAENPPGQEELEYARVLTLSPRGVILISDSYYNAEGAGAYDLFLGPNQERILAGTSDMVYRHEDPEDPEAEVKIERSKEGWIVAGAPAEPYDDPCVQSYSFLP